MRLNTSRAPSGRHTGPPGTRKMPLLTELRICGCCGTANDKDPAPLALRGNPPHEACAPTAPSLPSAMMMPPQTQPPVWKTNAHGSHCEPAGCALPWGSGRSSGEPKSVPAGEGMKKDDAVQPFESVAPADGNSGASSGAEHATCLPCLQTLSAKGFSQPVPR